MEEFDYLYGKIKKNKTDLATIAHSMSISIKKKNKVTVIADFEATETWTGAAMSADTSDYVSGKQSFLLTGAANTSRNIGYNVNLDLRNKNLAIDVKTADLTYLSGLSLYLSFGDTTFTKYAQISVIPTSIGVTDGVWEHRAIAPKDWTLAGGATIADLANVKSIRITIACPAGGIGTAHVDRLVYCDSILKNGAVVFTFDDGKDNIFTNAMPALDKYGFPATIYAITNNVGTAGYMTLAQLRTLRDKGWIIGSHTVSHAHLYSITAGEMATELTNSQTYLLSNGFAPGHKHLAYPFGENNAAVREKTRSLYSTGLSTIEKYFPEGVANPFMLPRKQINATLFPNVTPLLTVLDSIKANNSLLIVYCHNILDSAGDWTIAQFQQIVDYVATLGLDVLTIDDVAQMYGY